MDIDFVTGAVLHGPALLGVLAILALIDSTSFGTLLIPVWLLLAPGRLRPGRVLIYLATITAFYAAVGIMIALGATYFTDAISAALASPLARWLQLLLGAGMLILSFTMDTGTKKKNGTAESEPSEPGRLARWRARAMGVTEATTADATSPSSGAGSGTVTAERTGTVAPLMMLALTAAVIEVASMLPYLAGIGLISASGAGWPGSAGLILGYCLVMVLPALILLGARIFAHRAIEPLLQRVNDWVTKHAASSTAWIVGIVGFLLARDAVLALDLFDVVGRLI
ncbi:GAP family protein [Paramicrobacterium chengjingii]|uniref:GAP family protein n=1 Tax=Paramicrobacterium chengjingii TaxID=2769067 RepID=A0ABX6YIZ9_9MICO|nr:GAP family protein [Microbacterium chengjingii]QPZ38799.1 GAP family protein [Microbacterium chengjingii]